VPLGVQILSIPFIFTPAMSKSTVAQLVKLLVPAGKASPSPPVGPALGARGVKAIDFCKEFNARTSHYTAEIPIPTLITIQPDRTFTFVTRTPPTAYLLKKAAGVEKGSGSVGPNSDGGGSITGGKVGNVSLKHVYEIAKIKMEDLETDGATEERVVRAVIGTARSLGIEVRP